MSSISILGVGTYARAIGTRGVEAGHAVEVVGRDVAKAKDLAAVLGGGTTAGTFGTAPAGDIVILAVPYASAVPVVAQYGDALAGKVIIDISNTFTAADDTELVTPDGSSGAQEIAKAVPASAHVVKAFNTVFAHVLARHLQDRDVVPVLFRHRARSSRLREARRLMAFGAGRRLTYARTRVPSGPHLWPVARPTMPDNSRLGAQASRGSGPRGASTRFGRLDRDGEHAPLGRALALSDRGVDYRRDMGPEGKALALD
jgi:predicted dinucleotide-binding enzyme